MPEVIAGKTVSNSSDSSESSNDLQITRIQHPTTESSSNASIPEQIVRPKRIRKPNAKYEPRVKLQRIDFGNEQSGTFRRESADFRPGLL